MQYSDGARNGDVVVTCSTNFVKLKSIVESLVQMRWSADAGNELPEIVKH